MRPWAAYLKGPAGAFHSDRAFQKAPSGMESQPPNGLAYPGPGRASGRALGSGAGYPPSEGPRLPVGRVLEVEDGTVGAGTEVHRVRGMDGTIEISHGAEIVPRRVHEQSAAEATLSQPPEQPGARATQAGAEAVLAPAPSPAVWSGASAHRGGR